jgi:hypothetical protein
MCNQVITAGRAGVCGNAHNACKAASCKATSAGCVKLSMCTATFVNLSMCATVVCKAVNVYKATGVQSCVKLSMCVSYRCVKLSMCAKPDCVNLSTCNAAFV